MTTITLDSGRAVTITKDQQREADRRVACEQLREFVKMGDTVYTVLRHRSASGMFRVISLCVVRDGDIRRIDGLVCDALGYTWNRRHEGVPVSGCGMDMGFHLVYSLGRALFSRVMPTDAGYALKHHWL